jgi:hypothetical protein
VRRIATWESTILLAKRIALLFFVMLTVQVCGQEAARTTDYILGKEEKLEMIVHIWGEVRSPGEYRVAYDTDILELISKAGGPTSFANMKKVRLARTLNAEKVQSQPRSSRILEYNLKQYLNDKEDKTPVPVLQPGDVVVLSQNRWFRWRELVRVAQEAAMIASVYVWYLRAK